MYECIGCVSHRYRPKQRRRRTPTPLKKKQTKLSTSPTRPPTKVVMTPDARKESGTSVMAPICAARRRSSATHTPPRFAFHLISRRSESQPASGAPTALYNLLFTQTRRIGSGELRTDIADAHGDEACADERLVGYSVSLALGTI